jgi:hypothetical protein
MNSESFKLLKVTTDRETSEVSIRILVYTMQVETHSLPAIQNETYFVHFPILGYSEFRLSIDTNGSQYP